MPRRSQRRLRGSRGYVALFGRMILAGDDDISELNQQKAASPQQRESCVHADIEKRLKTVCKDMPEEEFHDLVAAMTREQLRSERLF